MATGDYANLASNRTPASGQHRCSQNNFFGNFKPFKQWLLFGSPNLTVRKFCIFVTQFIYVLIFLNIVARHIDYFPFQYKPTVLMMEIFLKFWYHSAPKEQLKVSDWDFVLKWRKKWIINCAHAAQHPVHTLCTNGNLHCHCTATILTMCFNW